MADINFTITLTEFCRNVPPPAVVRLTLDETEGRSKEGATVIISLHLQGTSEPDLKLHWLCQRYETERLMNNIFPDLLGQQIYSLYPYLRDLVHMALVRDGYTVIQGLYKGMDGIKPISGFYDCVDWHEEKGHIHLEMKSNGKQR